MEKRTLKEIAKVLNISEKKASKIKQEIESDFSCPSYMVWGTGKQKGYNVESFRRKL
jgi:hypothetical protein